MALPTLIPFVAGEDALAEDVNANFDAIAGRFNGGILDQDISDSAAIKGYKLASTAGDRVPETRLENNAVSARVLQSDVSAGAPLAAVATSAHIKDGIITGPKISSSATVDADRAVGSDHIKDDAILARHMAGLGVDGIKLYVYLYPSSWYFSDAASKMVSTGLSSTTYQVIGAYWAGVVTDQMALGSVSAGVSGGNIVIWAAMSYGLTIPANYIAVVYMART